MMLFWIVFALFCLGGLIFMLRFQKQLAAKAKQDKQEISSDSDD